MDVYDQMVNNAARELANEVDWGILADICLDNGWEEVVILNHTEKYRAGMAEWIYDNIKGDKTGYGNRWLFKRAKDATWFRMVWA